MRVYISLSDSSYAGWCQSLLVDHGFEGQVLSQLDAFSPEPDELRGGCILLVALSQLVDAPLAIAPFLQHPHVYKLALWTPEPESEAGLHALYRAEDMLRMPLHSEELLFRVRRAAEVLSVRRQCISCYQHVQNLESLQAHILEKMSQDLKTSLLAEQHVLGELRSLQGDPNGMMGALSGTLMQTNQASLSLIERILDQSRLLVS
jgi:signal transduction histidine kinase